VSPYLISIFVSFIYNKNPINILNRKHNKSEHLTKRKSKQLTKRKSKQLNENQNNYKQRKQTKTFRIIVIKHTNQ
jgi:hypothetical protein